MLIREVHAVPGLLLEVVCHQRGLSKEGLLYNNVYTVLTSYFSKNSMTTVTVPESTR